MLFIFILTIVLLLSFSAGDKYPSKASDQLLRMDLECVLLPSVWFVCVGALHALKPGPVLASIKYISREQVVDAV